MNELKSRWLQGLEKLHRISIVVLWDMVDALIEGVDNLTDGSKDQVADLLGEASEQLEVSVKTLENYIRIGRRWPQALRHGPPLTIHHHEVVSKLGREEADAYLTKAAEYGWSVARLRLEVSVAGVEAGGERHPIRNIITIQQAFGRAGVRVTVGKRKVTFELPAGTLTLRSDADMEWEVG